MTKGIGFKYFGVSRCSFQVGKIAENVSLPRDSEKQIPTRSQIPPFVRKKNYPKPVENNSYVSKELTTRSYNTVDKASKFIQVLFTGLSRAFGYEICKQGLDPHKNRINRGVIHEITEVESHKPRLAFIVSHKQCGA